ncbi:MAG: EscU/YscU/HrcU family type III secretion system export apparatus switch protein [Candidatus Tectomicrobia bacterium]|uniref:EscU/YscU/HrcU family type III secretion system export apparatus switch protein n=1 Tax=Tectimicrobiota bacterium TaxID=2528274 RepID=A0A932CR57_UNCTE|nr:EscU/YscU/HrcU family type III secretion system export apparatus switch protein [Candidatus Tectomicrobia bacterium]
MTDAPKPAKQKGAIALQYEPAQNAAPRVVAKGRGLMAERIIEIAQAHHIPIREDKELVELLSRLDLGQEIPPDLYRVVAEILVWVYRINQIVPRPPS